MKKLFFVVGAVIVLLGLGELGLRVFKFGSAASVLTPDACFEAMGKREKLELDPKVVVRPAFGTDRRTDGGYRPTAHSIQKSGKKRILLVGTELSQDLSFNRVLAKKFPPEGVEIWSAGINCLGPQAHYALFKERFFGIDADHVVYFLHQGLGGFPPLVRSNSGKLEVYRVGLAPGTYNRDLLFSSHLYRLYLSFTRDDASDNRLALQSFFDGLQSYQDHLKGSGKDFTVVLVPHLAQRKYWPRVSINFAQSIIDQMKARKIRVFDLDPAAQAVISRSDAPALPEGGVFSGTLDLFFDEFATSLTGFL
jgi:hypothetical protein